LPRGEQGSTPGRRGSPGNISGDPQPELPASFPSGAPGLYAGPGGSGSGGSKVVFSTVVLFVAMLAGPIFWFATRTPDGPGDRLRRTRTPRGVGRDGGRHSGALGVGADRRARREPPHHRFRRPGGLEPDFLPHFTSLVQPEDELVLICQTGNRTSFLASALAEQMESSRIRNVTHGILPWIQTGGPVVACRVEEGIAVC